MRIKSGVWYWLAMGSFATGLLYSMGLEGTCQPAFLPLFTVLACGW